MMINNAQLTISTPNSIAQVINIAIKNKTHIICQLTSEPMFLRRQGEARRSTPFQPPRRVRDSISVKNERKGGKIKGKKDKADWQGDQDTKGLGSPGHLGDALKTRVKTTRSGIIHAIY
jgi:hypothetical protein